MTEQTYNRVIGWQTTKTEAGYAWEVYSFDFGVARKVHATGVKASRAQAMTAAKNAVRFHKAQQRAQ